MSDPLPPGDKWTMTPRAQADVRDIDMNRLPSGPSSASSPSGPFPDVIRTQDGRTMVRQPDGSYAFTPNQPPPPWMQPAATVTAKSSLLAGHGLMATLATLATVAIVGVGLNMPSGSNDPGDIPPVYTARPSIALTINPGLATPAVLIDSGAARANQIVTDIVKSCLQKGVDDRLQLVFEATPGADLDLIEMPHEPDEQFFLDSVADSDLYTVTITATAGYADGESAQWAVDISTGKVIPLGRAKGMVQGSLAGGLYGCAATSELG